GPVLRRPDAALVEGERAAVLAQGQQPERSRRAQVLRLHPGRQPVAGVRAELDALDEPAVAPGGLHAAGLFASMGHGTINEGKLAGAILVGEADERVAAVLFETAVAQWGGAGHKRGGAALDDEGGVL